MGLVAFRWNRATTTAVAMAAMLVVLAVECGTEESLEYEHAKGQSEHAGKESWTGWAKDKISEGLGLKSDDTDNRAINSAKDKITGTGEYTAEKGEEMKNAAGEKGACAKNVVCDKAQEAKEKAKQGYEAVKNKAGETLESAKDTVANTYEDAKPKENKLFINEDIVGHNTRDDEL